MLLNKWLYKSCMYFALLIHIEDLVEKNKERTCFKRAISTKSKHIKITKSISKILLYTELHKKKKKKIDTCFYYNYT